MPIAIPFSFSMTSRLIFNNNLFKSIVALRSCSQHLGTRMLPQYPLARSHNRSRQEHFQVHIHQQRPLNRQSSQHPDQRYTGLQRVDIGSKTAGQRFPFDELIKQNTTEVVFDYCSTRHQEHSNDCDRELTRLSSTSKEHAVNTPTTLFPEPSADGE